MPRRGKRRNYRKAYLSGIYYISDAVTIREAIISFYIWQKGGRIRGEEVSGIPYELMSPEGRKNFEKNVIEPLKEWIVRIYVESAVDTARYRATVSKAVRWRPAYELVAKKLENFDFLESIIEKRPHEAYREIARELGLSWRTVRDAIWAFGYGGLRIW